MDDSNYYSALRSFIDRTGIIIIAVCIVALLGAFAYSCFLVSSSYVEQVKIEFVMPVDSTGMLSSSSIQAAESLKEELVRHEQLLEDRYKHTLEQKESINDLLSIGGMFLAVVLALFGFFGYRSLSTIEERVKNYAENTAEEATKDRLTSIKEDIEIDVMNSVKESYDKKFTSFSSSTKNQLEDQLKARIAEKTQDIADLKASVGDLSMSLGNLDEKLSKLTDRILKLESKDSEQDHRRRTIKGGGEKE